MMRTIRLSSLAPLCVVAALTACGQAPATSSPAQAPLETRQDHAAHDHSAHPTLLWRGGSPAPGGDVSFDAKTSQLLAQQAPFKHVGLLIDGHHVDALALRTRGLDGRWSSWTKPELTWSEGLYHVGRLLLLEPATALELRGSAELLSVSAQLYEQWPSQPERLTKDLPLATPKPITDLNTSVRAQALAPESLVISRDKWGARDPGKICGDVVAPYRMSIHHTAQPDNDGDDPAARLRQMQAYHIDSNGWCDIGYHFVVSQSGKLYQGRSDEQRPGAHVGNQNAGNVGISFIGNYQESQPPAAQLDAAVSLMKWVKDTYNIPWTRDAVRGHRQWPGQSTSCPGDNLLSKIDDMMAQTTGSAPKTYDIDLKVNLIGPALKDLHIQGSSAPIKDLLVKDTLQAELILTNKSDEALRGVKLGYWIEEPFLKATSYTIESDHPAKDGKSWMTNDADGAEGNPPKDAMGGGGELIMYAFGPGESKRVLIDLSAEQYSLGGADHPDVRAWVKHIDDLYGEQEEFNQTPTINKADEVLQAFAQLDILSSNEWQFDSAEAQDTESWSECVPGQDTDRFEADTTLGALTLHVIGDDSCALAPSWTKINADEEDQLVIRMQSQDGPHLAAIYWASPGEPISEQRVVRFEALGDGKMNTYTIPMSEHERWAGQITTLRVDPLDGAVPGSSDQGVYQIDAVFTQSTATKTTSSALESYQDKPWSLWTGEVPYPAKPNPEQPAQPEDQGDTVSVKGCSSAPGTPASPGAWFMAALSLVALRRRRAHRISRPKR